jgi:hypothetical protein
MSLDTSARFAGGSTPDADWLNCIRLGAEPTRDCGWRQKLLPSAGWRQIYLSFKGVSFAVAVCLADYCYAQGQPRPPSVFVGILGDPRSIADQVCQNDLKHSEVSAEALQNCNENIQDLLWILVDQVRGIFAQRRRDYVVSLSELQPLDHWSEEQANSLVPPEYSHYIVLSASEASESGLPGGIPKVMRINLEVGRFSTDRKIHELTYYTDATDITTQITIGPLLSSPTGYAAQFFQLIKAPGDRASRWEEGNVTDAAKLIANQTIYYLPELDSRFGIYLSCFNDEEQTDDTQPDDTASDISYEAETTILADLAEDLTSESYQPKWYLEPDNAVDLRAFYRDRCKSGPDHPPTTARFILHSSLQYSLEGKDMASGPNAGRIPFMLKLSDEFMKRSFSERRPRESPIKPQIDGIISGIRTEVVMKTFCADNKSIMRRARAVAENLAEYVRDGSSGSAAPIKPIWLCQQGAQ